MTDPAAALVAPVASAPIPDIVDQLLHFPDLVSPSTWLIAILDQVCGMNPAEWLTAHVSGDWERMSRASSALEHLAEFHESMATGLIAARRDLGDAWDGEAAEAALAYLGRLARATDEQAPPLRTIAEEVDNIAQGMKSTQETLLGLLGMLIDYAIAAAISAAAAASTSWTVVGGLIGGGATAYSIARAVQLWLEIISVHARAVAMVDALIGLAAGYLGSIHGFATHPLPAGAYDNRQVP